MSYDIRFKVKVDGTNHFFDTGYCDANITWNVRKIIELSTGLPWKNCENNGLCKDVVPHIYDGLKELKMHPWKYKPFEASNGWGTVEGVIHFFEEIIRSWEEMVKWDEEIADLVTFWIE